MRGDLGQLNHKLHQQNESILSVNEMVKQVADDTDTIQLTLLDHNALTAAKLTNIEELLQPEIDYLCGGTGGWRRAVYLDMADPATDCPTGLKLTSYSKRTCGRDTDGCNSAYFPISGGTYNQVCGRIKAYQFGWPSGLYGTGNTIDGQYFTGVALMHGTPRQHIWTFVAGAAENKQTQNAFLCPCDINRTPRPIPSFIGDDYFCEAAYQYPVSFGQNVFHPDDPLWDGQGCHSSSTCCTFHGPPYFTKALSGSTTDNLELRMCGLYGPTNEDAPVELIELYVK